MAFEYQILKDSTQNTIIKLVGIFEGSDEDNAARIQANTLYGALDVDGNPLYTSLSEANTARDSYALTVSKIIYDVNMPTPGYIQLYWKGDTNATIATLSGFGEIVGQTSGTPTIPNNAEGGNGDIGIKSFGATTNCSYTIIIELKKTGSDYNAGQFDEPIIFNYGKYGVTP